MSGPRLSIIPARAATDRALKPRDLQVLCVLGRHTDDLGWCRKSQVKMADEMGCARSTVFEAIERLVRAGYLERHIQEEDNGRDSPHVYRVILDPIHPSVERVRDSDCAPVDPCRQAGTPAGISAPPAGPEPAPPAGPEPAPKNDPFRTTPSEREERGAREREGEIEDRKRIERQGWALLARWPGFAGMPKKAALRAWMSLSPEDRDLSVRRFDGWLALLKAQGKSFVPAPSTYFGERLFADVADPKPEPFNEYAPPFGPVWGGWVWGHLLSVSPGPDGWPLITGLFRKAAFRQGAKFAEHLHSRAALMEAVPVGSVTFEAWRAEHEARGWPWIPDPGDQPVVFFPAGGPAGLEAFEAAIRGEAKNHDGGEREAAE